MQLVCKVRQVYRDMQTFLENFVTERGNIRRLEPLPRFSDLKVIVTDIYRILSEKSYRKSKAVQILFCRFK
jgi:hypothetical protein